jgi:hypothetical protein
MHVWTEVVSTNYVAAMLNRSIFNQIKAHFPAVKFSNFGYTHHTDPSGVVPPRTTLWAYEMCAIGLGAHVGTLFRYIHVYIYQGICVCSRMLSVFTRLQLGVASSHTIACFSNVLLIGPYILARS